MALFTGLYYSSLGHNSLGQNKRCLTQINHIDEMLFAFMVPLLPYIFENRLGLDATLTQKYTSIFLVEGALISIISSPLIGDIADRASSKKTLLLGLLVLTLISVLCLSMTTSRMSICFRWFKRHTWTKIDANYNSDMAVRGSVFPMHRQ